MLFLKPSIWDNYELIDSGGYKKLEKFGKIILSRPEPQAVWDPALPSNEWDRLSNAEFRKEGSKDPEKGEWFIKKNAPSQWLVDYSKSEMNLKFRLGLSSFKHVGLFPEQCENWEYIYKKVKALNVHGAKVLNLFAYTGGASLAARAAGADVTHVDSVKQVITWARENMEASNQKDIRWVVEDAMKFVQREVRRGNKYQGIILDPPAYGRGPEGEKWLIEDHLNPLLKSCKQILDPVNNFFILNTYSIGFSSLILETLVESIFGKNKNSEFGELYLEDRFEKKLPLGSFYRFASR